VGSCGIQVGGVCEDSRRVLNDVETMNSNGLTNSRVRMTSTP
jgi:hypothetical protein